MLEEATAIWNRDYGDAHIEVDRKKPDPFLQGEWLGKGGCGNVYETELGTIPLALKRIHTHTKDDLIRAKSTEVVIMQQLNKDPHHHIVHLVGSYEKPKQRGGFELGLLIWPIASYDLAALLQDIDIVGGWIVSIDGSIPDGEPAKDTDQVILAIERFKVLEADDSILEEPLQSLAICKELYEKALNRMGKSLRCITRAIQWLHDKQIQHKDLKPSQILLSNSGVWLSDFGWSRDMSNYAESVTAEGRITTEKYLAPERAAQLPCGRSQDIFGLGCIFLEVGYQLAKPQRIEVVDGKIAPWSRPKWCFHKNINEARAQTELLENYGLGYLAPTIREMLDEDPLRRPKIDRVLASLALNDKDTTMDTCCAAIQLQRHKQPASQNSSEAASSGDTAAINQGRSGRDTNEAPEATEDKGVGDNHNVAGDRGLPQIKVWPIDGDDSTAGAVDVSPVKFSDAQSPELEARTPQDMAPVWSQPNEIDLEYWDSSMTTLNKPSQPVMHANEINSADVPGAWSFRDLSTSYGESHHVDDGGEGSGDFYLGQKRQYSDVVDSTSSTGDILGNQRTLPEGENSSIPILPVPILLSCDLCGAIFKGNYRRGNLARHTRAKHASEVQVLACGASGCERVFHWKDARWKHERKHHPELARAAIPQATSSRPLF